MFKVCDVNWNHIYGNLTLGKITMVQLETIGLLKSFTSALYSPHVKEFLKLSTWKVLPIDEFVVGFHENGHVEMSACRQDNKITMYMIDLAA